MIRLFIRQIKKHAAAFLLLLILWTVFGYYIFENKHKMLAYLSAAFLSKPAPGFQNSKKAWKDYILPAEEMLSNAGFYCRNMPEFLGGCSKNEINSTKIRLDLMEKACRKFGASSLEKYNPHWLETVREWNLSTEKRQEKFTETIEPDAYWKDNQIQVLDALKLLIEAGVFAQEIPPDIHGKKDKKTLLLPEIIIPYAKAVCREDLILYAWSNYIEFMEIQAFNIAKKKESNLERIYFYPDERELYSLSLLKKNTNYLFALNEFTAGSPPENQLSGCRNAPLNAVCVSPEETIKILNKVVYFSDPERLASVFLKLGKLYFLSDNPEDVKKAISYYNFAEKSEGLKNEALLFSAKYYIHFKKTDEAYRTLKEMSRNLPHGGKYNPEFRNLARIILLLSGRSKDADCFSKNAELSIGVRTHCTQLKL